MLISPKAPLFALLATLSLAVTPAAAADLPQSAPDAPGAWQDWSWDAGSDTVQNHSYYRYGRNRVGVGDVLTGVLIIGGIAAIANSASRNARRDRDYRYPARYPGERYDTRSSDDSRGIDRAVSMCVREIERDVRVAEVDSVDRDADGWRVAGSLYNGEGFTCRIGADGRIDDVDYSGRASGWSDRGYSAGNGGIAGEDRQYDDARYRAAWADVGGTPASGASGSTMPAYPGGPLADEADAGWSDDGTDAPYSDIGYPGARD